MFNSDFENDIRKRVSIWNSFLIEKRSKINLIEDQNYSKILLENKNNDWSKNVKQGIEDWNNSNFFPKVNSVKDIFIFIINSNRWNLFPILDNFYNNFSFIAIIFNCIDLIKNNFERLYVLYQLASRSIYEKIIEIFLLELTNCLIDNKIYYIWKSNFNLDSFPDDFLELISLIINYDSDNSKKCFEKYDSYDIFYLIMLLRKDAAKILHISGFKAKELFYINKFGNKIIGFPKKTSDALEIHFVYFHKLNIEYPDENHLEIISLKPNHNFLEIYYQFWNKIKEEELKYS